MKREFFNFRWLPIAMIAGGLFLQSCQKNDDDTPNGGEGVFHVAKEVSTPNKATYVSKLSNLREGSVSANKGYSLETVASNRLYASSDGKILYNLKYAVGTIEKYTFSEKPDDYIKEKDLDISGIVGNKNLRWKVVNDQVALAYNVSVEHKKDDQGNYQNTSSTLHIVNISLPDFVLGQKKEIVMPKLPEIEGLPNPHIWRVDNPVIHNNKVYIGLAMRGYDGAKNVNATNYGEGKVLVETPASTLVLDYPTFENPRVISSGLPKGIGDTYGYRTPAYFVAESQDVYHVNMQNSHIFKIKNGEYDNTYDFDLAKALGVTGTTIGGTGIFYAGNGIAFVPYYDQSKGKKEAAWSIARVDINRKTAIKMNFPENLDLSVYQNAKKGKDGKVYFALVARGSQSGKVYIVDPTKESPNAFEEGTSLQVAAGVSYVGIY
ncbi:MULTISPECIES: hypothetical protein [Capnocytophaga]|uniref:hypothetical protein n=1 Tax=Capnocytophaga TaxID=1016 RepID=UPI0012FFD03F|nr:MULTISPECIES: hypothetical protein [Capnocytophaga]